MNILYIFPNYINFDVAEKEPSSILDHTVQVLQDAASTVLSNELTSQVVKGVGLFGGLTEQDAAVAVVHKALNSHLYNTRSCCLKVLLNKM